MLDPQVLILSRNEFQRRLMSDLVRCNDLTVQSIGARDADRWIDSVVAGRVHPGVVVIDLDEPALEPKRRIESLRRLPVGQRPKILGLKREAEAAPPGADAQGLEGVLAGNFDLGAFSRTIARMALEARLAAT